MSEQRRTLSLSRKPRSTLAEIVQAKSYSPTPALSKYRAKAGYVGLTYAYLGELFRKEVPDVDMNTAKDILLTACRVYGLAYLANHFTLTKQSGQVYEWQAERHGETITITAEITE